MSSIGNMGKAVGVAFTGPILAAAATVLVAGINYTAGNQDLVSGIYDYAMKAKLRNFTKEEVVGLGVLGVGAALLSLALWGVCVLVKRCCAKNVTLSGKDTAEKVNSLSEKKSTVAVLEKKLATQAQAMQAMIARLVVLEESTNDKSQLEKTQATLGLEIQDLKDQVVSLTEASTKATKIMEVVSPLSAQISTLSDRWAVLSKGVEGQKTEIRELYADLSTQKNRVDVLEQDLDGLADVAEFHVGQTVLNEDQQTYLALAEAYKTDKVKK